MKCESCGCSQSISIASDTTASSVAPSGSVTSRRKFTRPVGLHAARGHRGRIGDGVLAVQRDHRDALAAVELIGDEAAEAKAGLARLVDQEVVVDAHQLDEVVREQHELRSRAPRMIALARRREAHGAVPLGQCIEVVRDDKRMFETERAVCHGEIPARQTVASVQPSSANSASRSGASAIEKNSSSCGGFTSVPLSMACAWPR